MSADVNIKTIQLVYEAFSRGDVEHIVAQVTDDVDWASEAAGSDVPWHGPHSGQSGVLDFFTAFGSSMEVQEFDPITYAATESEVLTLVRFTATSRVTGKTMTQHLHHYFRFRDGKIAYYRGSEDTALTAATLQA